MFKDIWDNFSRYIKVSRKESKLALMFGILGAFLETCSIYLLANLINNISFNSPINISFQDLNYLTRTNSGDFSNCI